jgi:hypothetical protein
MLGDRRGKAMVAIVHISHRERTSAALPSYAFIPT